MNSTSSSQTHHSNSFKIVETAPIWITLSGSLILISLIAITLSCLKFGSPVRLGLDFTGGTKIEYKFEKQNKSLSAGEVREKVLDKIDTKLGSDSLAQVSGEQYLILRTKNLSLDQREKLDALLKENFGNFSVLAVDTVGGTIGSELLRSGLLALIITLIGILAFVSYRFRRDFAICAIIALCHDVIIVIGLFAALGILAGIEVNTLFLTACLTVLGFSIHDTIVVFDRIRENTRFLSKKRNLVQIINESIGQVWFRSLCTSFTVLLTLGSLFLFGGETTRLFSGAMFVGVLAGAYSSIFIAAVLLGWWHSKNEDKKQIKKN